MNFKIYRTANGLKKYPMHKHKRYEIMMYVAGNGLMRTTQGDIPFEKGTIIIVPPGVEHGSISKEGFKNISVEGDFESTLHFAKVIAFKDNRAEEGKNLAELIYRNRYGNERYLSTLCMSYIYFLAQRFKFENDVYQSIEEAIKKLSEHAFYSDVNATNILRESGYSEDYIRACFKKITGKTPNNFLTDIRIDKACFLIDIYRDVLTLSEIAEKCGYVDYVYFSKKFKSVTGMSPKNYKYR